MSKYQSICSSDVLIRQVSNDEWVTCRDHRFGYWGGHLYWQSKHDDEWNQVSPESWRWNPGKPGSWRDTKRWATVQITPLNTGTGVVYRNLTWYEFHVWFTKVWTWADIPTYGVVAMGDAIFNYQITVYSLNDSGVSKYRRIPKYSAPGSGKTVVADPNDFAGLPK